ncbi:hypothetical protein [Bacillus massiliigorillae]|uniref:hypothetical protein n=1 Tax=Bacillus massiliigorillae TaxID=1243664 RepID=UPI0003A439DD|nr:hypothetical protein [Bacillus massiliigorillae]
MYMAITVFILVCMIISLVRFFSNRNWVLIYSVFGNEEYFKIIAKLKAKGVKYKVKVPFRGFESRTERFVDQTQYDIYVKKDEEYLGVKTLR